MKRTIIAMAVLVSYRVATASTWEYRETRDAMDSSIVKTATASSDNSLSLSFPYSGDNHAQLQVRQRKQDGLSIIFAIEKGQLVCGVYDCRLMIRFDEAQPIRFSASPSSDHDSKVLFIRNERKFVDLATKAKTIRIAPLIYQGGGPVLEFKIATPLVWRPSAKAAVSNTSAAAYTKPPSAPAQPKSKMTICSAPALAQGLTGADRTKAMMECMKKG